MPKGYWIAHVTITDTERYKGYQDIAPAAFQKFNATFLARGGASKTLEGDTWQRHVVIEFESMEQALACYHSDDYKQARKRRDGACIVSVNIVEGME